MWICLVLQMNYVIKMRGIMYFKKGKTRCSYPHVKSVSLLTSYVFNTICCRPVSASATRRTSSTTRTLTSLVPLLPFIDQTALPWPVSCNYSPPERGNVDSFRCRRGGFKRTTALAFQQVQWNLNAARLALL